MLRYTSHPLGSDILQSKPLEVGIPAEAKRLLALLQGQTAHHSSSTPKVALTIGRFFPITKAGREQAKMGMVVPMVGSVPRDFLFLWRFFYF